MTDPIPCPADLAAGEDPHGDRTCGGWYDTKNGAVMHAVNKDDDHHADVTKGDAYAALAAAEVDGDDDGGDDGADGSDPGSDGDGGDDGDRLTAEIPEADDDDPPAEPDTASCPNCGADLGHTEEEVREFVESHDRAFCDVCGYRIRLDGEGTA